MFDVLPYLQCPAPSDMYEKGSLGVKTLSGIFFFFDSGLLSFQFYKDFNWVFMKQTF